MIWYRTPRSRRDRESGRNLTWKNDWKTLLTWGRKQASRLEKPRELKYIYIYICVCVCVCVCSVTHPCPNPSSPVDCILPGSSVHGIFQARILDWVAISSSRECSRPRGWTCVPCIGRWIFYHWATWKSQGDPHQNIL